MKYRPIGDRVLIKPNPIETSKGGFELLEQDRKQEPMGEVIAVGTGKVDENSTLVLILKLLIFFVGKWMWINKTDDDLKQFEPSYFMPVKPGDIVQYGQYAGTKVRIEDVEYILIRQDDIFMIFD